MQGTRSIRVITHDLALRIDPGGLGARGAGHVDSGEGPLVQHEAMVCAGGIEVMAHDLAPRIDPGGLGARGAGHVDRDEGGPPYQREAMLRAAGIQEIAHDPGPRIDPGGLSARGARHIDGREGKGTCRGWSAEEDENSAQEDRDPEQQGGMS